MTFDEPHTSNKEKNNSELKSVWQACPWPHENDTIKYPNNHGYFDWLTMYEAYQQKNTCMGPKYSKMCYWGEDKNHKACNEECYCDCHWPKENYKIS